jgi:hypothetical protein
MEWSFEGFEASAAQRLVLLIDSRLDGEWTRYDDGPGLWRWQFDDEDYGDRPPLVAVNGCSDRILVPAHFWPAKVGPTVMVGRFGDVFASVTLPHVSDGYDAEDALRLLWPLVPGLGKDDTDG